LKKRRRKKGDRRSKRGSKNAAKKRVVCLVGKQPNTAEKGMSRHLTRGVEMNDLRPKREGEKRGLEG